MFCAFRNLCKCCGERSLAFVRPATIGTLVSGIGTSVVELPLHHATMEIVFSLNNLVDLVGWYNFDDALIEGLEQNKDFFTLLLNNDEIKRSVLGIFASEIYTSLRDLA